ADEVGVCPKVVTTRTPRLRWRMACCSSLRRDPAEICRSTRRTLMPARQRRQRSRQRAWRATLAASALFATCLLGACASTGEATARIKDREGDSVPAHIAWRTTSAYGTSGRMLVTTID